MTKAFTIFSKTFLLIGLVSCMDHRPPVEPISSCRVIKHTFKNQSGDLPDRESIDYNGATYDMGVAAYESYQFDELGRTIQIRYENTRSSASAYNYTVRYEYLPTQIKGTRAYDNGNTYSILHSLNSLGYISNGHGYTWDYDSHGYLINKRWNPGFPAIYTYENGNLVKEDSKSMINSSLSEHVISTFEYDLSRPSFPAALENPYYITEAGFNGLSLYLGRSSRNLLTKKVSHVTSMYNGVETKSTTTHYFTYTFDEKGLVQRLISHSVSTVEGSSDVYDLIGVHDFDYECVQ